MEKKSLLESNNMLAIQMTNKNNSSTNNSWAMAQAIKDMFQRNWTILVSHIFREGNQDLDRLSKIGRDYPLGLHALDSPPSNL